MITAFFLVEHSSGELQPWMSCMVVSEVDEGVQRLSDSRCFLSSSVTRGSELSNRSLVVVAAIAHCSIRMHKALLPDFGIHLVVGSLS